jgi:hypothetical protein
MRRVQYDYLVRDLQALVDGVQPQKRRAPTSDDVKTVLFNAMDVKLTEDRSGGYAITVDGTPLLIALDEFMHNK